MPVKLDLAAAARDPTTRHTLRNISLAVAKSKRIVVVTGAGISCSSGIPDFRSSDGLYNLVKQQYPDVVLKGRDLFDASLFRDPLSTSVFYTFISQLKRSIDNAAPSPTHKFIKTLDSKKRLLRSYTQNIDGLEERVGLPGSSSETVRITAKGKTKIRNRDVRNVQLHGDIHRVRCTMCSKEYPCTAQHLALFEQGDSPDCPECTSRSEARVARSARALKIGNLRPAIVLYDEPHPLGDDIGAIHAADVNKKPDMLIILGTSLKVHGLKKLVKDFAKAVHASSPKPAAPSLTAADINKAHGRPKAGPSKAACKASPKNAKNLINSLAGRVVFVNRTPPGADWEGIIDYWIEAECDQWVARVEEEWKSMRPSDWEVQQTLAGSSGFAATKTKAAAAGVPKGLAPKVPPPGDRRDDNTENIPVSLRPTTPCSPSKRRQHTSHYPNSERDADIECSPSKRAAKRGMEILTPTTAMTMRVKKLALEGDQSMHIPERRMLFGDLANGDSKSKHGLDGVEYSSSEDEDEEDNADVPLRLTGAIKQRQQAKSDLTAPAPRTTRARSRTGTRLKMEVLIDSVKPTA
ncbi:DHS-like NAD/FAD-binding domain-containing protein [Punctularia strigosozonata HHB-11173 SS5]|uniref:DHS-like NAD/FAD-binding domain-containing protein n=1 Tax=Punctularia strigosozonata (strain HHB-11173) TaxID=741275 RepID=UPI00044183F0|nr:DHS-like NAD/FAD-binding domain-containing protein [Punctularia strigosozonata HHB-11173 SS5]EIN14004.1 DHS-like NAD/FAD-binding domain-containing protein [Punctularia strigosozonata HHB-11173 SS5]